MRASHRPGEHSRAADHRALPPRPTARSPSASTPGSRATRTEYSAFEAKKCKVYTTQGVTLGRSHMRTSRDSPKYTVMFVDDIGIELAKREADRKLPA